MPIAPPCARYSTMPTQMANSMPMNTDSDVRRQCRPRRTSNFSTCFPISKHPPVFTQQPTIAVRVNRNRKWILGAAAGAGLAAVGVGVLVIIATWHGGPSPSPPARVAAPTAPAAAPTHIRSSQSPGGFLPLAAVIGEVSGDFQDTYGNPPERVECVGDLAGRVGASERCSIIDNGKRYIADVTVTAVNGDRVSTNHSIAEAPSTAAPAPP